MTLDYVFNYYDFISRTLFQFYFISVNNLRPQVIFISMLAQST